MKNLKSLGIAATLLLAVGVADARAGLITMVGGTEATMFTPGSNNVIPYLWGFDNANLYLNGEAGVTYLVEFTLIGSDSAYTNTLMTDGGTKALTETDHEGQTRSYTVTGGGLLDFRFTTPGFADIVNGDNGDIAGRSFFVSFCGVSSPIPDWFTDCNIPRFLGGPDTGDEAWLGLDDSGRRADKDFDDWVGKIKVTRLEVSTRSRVPDGGSALALLGIALTGLGVVRRRLS